MKKKFRILLIFILALSFTSCNNNDDNKIEDKAKSVSELIENLDEDVKLAKDNDEVENAKDDPVDNRDLAKKRWEDSKNKEKKLDNSKEEKLVSNKVKNDENTLSNAENNLKDKKTSDVKTLRLKVFGDTMAHLGQIQYAYNYGGGSYDFSNQFSYIKDYVEDADLSITNYETTTNPNREYSGFPRFNAPASYLNALKDVGFDVVTTANNHSLDTDEEGIFTTIDAIKDAGLDYVGTSITDRDKILYKEVNGIKLAILAYTYGANGIDDLLTLREEVDSLNYLHEEEIKKDIETAKKNKADFILVYPHWGIEYQSVEDVSQSDLAKKMLDWGADIIIGNHPHVVQPYEIYESEDGRSTFIAYALGNFISYQSLEVNDDIRTEQNVSFDITLEKDLNNDKARIRDFKANPLWVGSNYDDYGKSVKTYLCEDFLEGGKYYDQVSEEQRDRIRQAYNDTMTTLGYDIYD